MTPPSHTTRHTGPYHGGAIWLHAVRCRQSAEAHLIKEAVVQCSPYPWGMAESPWTFATPGGNVRQAWVDPPLDQCRLPSPVHLPGLPWEASETMTYPAVHLPQHRGRLAEATVALPSLQRRRQRRDDGLQATPVVRVQSALTRALNRSRAFGATFRRPGDFPPVKLHPRKLRCWGQATALFCACTLSCRRWVMNRLILAMPRAPARRLRT